LADAPRSGRPDTFTAQQTCALIALACESLRIMADQSPTGRRANSRTKRSNKPSFPASPSGRQSPARRNRLATHRSRYWLNAKPDPQKDDKIRVLCQIYQQAQDAARRGN